MISYRMKLLSPSYERKVLRIPIFFFSEAVQLAAFDRIQAY